MEVQRETDSTRDKKGVTAGRRFTLARFGLAGGALAAMVIATMLNTTGLNFDKQPLLSSPQTETNQNPDAGDSDLSKPFGPSTAAPSQPGRIYGNSVISTSLQVATTAFPNGASRVYLAQSDNPVDALPASVLSDGPVILVPKQGNVPPEVFNTIKALHPSQIVVLGGNGAIDQSVADQIATYTGISNITRLAGATRVQTAIEIARFANPGGASKVYIADAYGPSGAGSPDAVAAGVLSDGPILTVTNSGSDQMAVAQALSQLGTSQLVALGGNKVVPDSTLTSISPGSSKDRIAGADRYQTSQAIAKRVFPSANQVYLASGSKLAYALMAGSLTTGPVLLMPEQADANTRNLVTAFGNPNVTVIGDTQSVTDTVMNVASGYAEAPVANEVAQNMSTQPTYYLKYSMQPSPSDAEKEVAVYNEVNAERMRRGVSPLARNPIMDDAARAWAQQVARTGVFKHSSHTNLQYSNLMPAGWKLAGENMAGYYFVDAKAYAEGTRALWVNSPDHLANLARPVFNTTGIGVATGRDWVYVVQNFGQY